MSEGLAGNELRQLSRADEAAATAAIDALRAGAVQPVDNDINGAVIARERARQRVSRAEQAREVFDRELADARAKHQEALSEVSLRLLKRMWGPGTHFAFAPGRLVPVPVTACAGPRSSETAE